MRFPAEHPLPPREAGNAGGWGEERMRLGQLAPIQILPPTVIPRTGPPLSKGPTLQPLLIGTDPVEGDGTV